MGYSEDIKKSNKLKTLYANVIDEISVLEDGATLIISYDTHSTREKARWHIYDFLKGTNMKGGYCIRRKSSSHEPYLLEVEKLPTTNIGQTILKENETL